MQNFLKKIMRKFGEKVRKFRVKMETMQKNKNFAKKQNFLKQYKIYLSKLALEVGPVLEMNQMFK